MITFFSFIAGLFAGLLSIFVATTVLDICCWYLYDKIHEIKESDQTIKKD
jgi:hypothetical protein